MQQPETRFSADARNFRRSAIRAMAHLINDPAVISFAGGVPNPETFPAEALAEHAARVIRDRSSQALQYGPTPGRPRLRELLTAISGERNIACEVSNVLVTSGSQQALSLLSHALLDPGDVVLVELPTYIGASASFHGRRAELVGVEQDDDGLIPDSLRRTAMRQCELGRTVKFLYTIPNFQNPSGRLMTRRRRREALAIAAELDFLIIEDDPYGELVYDAGADTTPMKADDGEGRVVYLSTFSKTLAPGLRCGWVVADRSMIEILERAKEAADLCSGILDQAIVEELCSAGELRGQIEKVRGFYRERRNALIGALETELRGRAEWTPALGGLFTFVTLADDRDTGELLERAVAAGVAYIPGMPFFVDGRGRNTMRLTFAKESDARMRDGVARLARVFFDQES